MTTPTHTAQFQAASMLQHNTLTTKMLRKNRGGGFLVV